MLLVRAFTCKFKASLGVENASQALHTHITVNIDANRVPTDSGWS